MELGYAVTIPTYVLLDANLSPLERLLFGVISAHTNQQGHCTASNSALATNLRFKADGVTKQVSPESLERMLAHLVELEHIQIIDHEGTRVIMTMFQRVEVKVQVEAKKPKPNIADYSATAKEILAYLSECSIVRGYRKTAFKETKSNISVINARLSEGYSKEACKSIINIKFQDSFFTDNPKYLVPQTLFRASNIERYLTEASEVKGVENMKITKNGWTKSTECATIETDVKGVQF